MYTVENAMYGKLNDWVLQKNLRHVTKLMNAY